MDIEYNSTCDAAMEETFDMFLLKYKSEEEMIGKIVIVTGANTGIGFETAKDMARRGAKVILACRDINKGIAARDAIIAATGNRHVLFKQINLASFKSIRNFVDDILYTEPRIHVLINNAGIGKLDNSLTEDLLPIEVQVNYFGPFLLTILLLRVLKRGNLSRIVNVSSVMHRFGKVNIENFDKPATSHFEHMMVYSNTKLANILFTNKLSRELEETNVTVNSVHPGFVSTDIFRDNNFISRLFIKLFARTPWQGAQTSIYVAVAPQLTYVTGKYFSNCAQAKESKAARDRRLADQLWELSKEVVFVLPYIREQNLD